MTDEERSSARRKTPSELTSNATILIHKLDIAEASFPNLDGSGMSPNPDPREVDSS
jgi:hypothetical protein